MDQAVFWALVTGVPSAVYLAVWGLSKVLRLVRGWRYDWSQAKHLTGPPVAVEVPGRDFYGAASLADELAWLSAPVGCTEACASYQDGRCNELCGPGEYPPEPDWRAQTRADLAPEALDSGPGEAPSVDLGPDPDGCVVPSSPESASAALGNENQGSGHSLNPAGWLRGFSGILASTTTNLARDPDDPYDPEEDAPWSVIEPEPTRLADTGDILDAHLAADVAAYQRAQDDQVRAWCSGWERERREYARQLAEAWA